MYTHSIHRMFIMSGQVDVAPGILRPCSRIHVFFHLWFDVSISGECIAWRCTVTCCCWCVCLFVCLLVRVRVCVFACLIVGLRVCLRVC